MLGNHENCMLLRGPCLSFLIATDPGMAAIVRQALPDEPLPPVLCIPATETKHKIKTKKRKLDPWEAR